MTAGDPVDYTLASINIQNANNEYLYDDETLRNLMEVRVNGTKSFEFTQTDIDNSK